MCTFHSNYISANLVRISQVWVNGSAPRTTLVIHVRHPDYVGSGRLDDLAVTNQ